MVSTLDSSAAGGNLDWEEEQGYHHQEMAGGVKVNYPRVDCQGKIAGVVLQKHHRGVAAAGDAIATADPLGESSGYYYHVVVEVSCHLLGIYHQLDFP